MAHVHTPRRKPSTKMGRILLNLAKLPRRTVSSVGKLFAPQYRLERDAHRIVEEALAPERRKRLEAIPGMSSKHECALLFSLAFTAPAGGMIVEIGAWKGKSAAWLTEASNLRRTPLPIVSIDPHQLGSWETFQSTVRDFELERRGLTVMRGGSHDAGVSWKRPISLLWVDGDHDYEPVLRDIEDFTPHLLPNAYVIFDDATTGDCPGVEQALKERMINNLAFHHVGPIRHLQLFQKR